MFTSIRWRIAVPYILLILLAMAGLAAYLSRLVRDTCLDSLESQLASEGQLIGDALPPSSTWNAMGEDLDALAGRYADLIDAQVAIIGVDGIVLGDSHQDRTRMGNQLPQPEIREALNSGQARSLRFSQEVGYDMMYVAVRVAEEGRVAGVVRVALPLRQVEADLTHLRGAVFSAALLATLGAVILALVIAESTARPVRELTEVVKRVTEGELGARLLPTTRDEVGTLTGAFNQMSDRLRGTIAKLVEERNRLTTVLDNMADGVVITDGRGRVRLINPAAGRLLGVAEEAALGRPFAQVARDHRIIGLWQQCYEQRREQFEPVEVSQRGLFLQAIVTPLQGAGPQASLVIFQDLTRVRRLETVRRDFISNISHELRTPLASLKALVETLRDGAMEDPPAARRFLNRMDVEVDALAQIVQELLELSRIESGQVPLRLASVSIDDVVTPSVERLRPQAARADLQLTVDLPPDLPPILADLERVQQVVTNLVHNAIKFTPAGGNVRVVGLQFEIADDGDVQSGSYRLNGTEARSMSAASAVSGGELPDMEPDLLSSGDWVAIAVEDTGVGIPAVDLPRIFERFYKADRARSGGGTGLGLAIAKHIVQAHDGRIWAQSVEGKGSTFYVAFPALTNC